MARGGGTSGGPVWPAISSAGSVATSTPRTKGSSNSAAVGTATSGVKQKSTHGLALQLSAGGQPSQSPISPSVIAAGDMPKDMLVRFDACATLPAAKTARKTITKRRTKLSIPSCYLVSASCPGTGSRIGQARNMLSASKIDVHMADLGIRQSGLHNSRPHNRNDAISSLRGHQIDDPHDRDHSARVLGAFCRIGLGAGPNIALLDRELFFVLND